MKNTLNLSPDLSLPIDAATQTCAHIGRKGSGKTYGAGKFVELLLAANVQCVILDTVGNWYGLRIAADGKGKGFDVVVFGGLRKDVALTPDAGALMADVVVDTGRSVIMDVSQFNFADRRRFAAAFGERLWTRKKGESHPTPLHLVIEESQLIVPQDVRGDVAKMVHVYEEIIRLGRNYGIGATMISQRPQSVNKEVLNQTECLFAYQTNGAQERKALRDWIVHEGLDVNLVNELPSLPTGTAFVWSPQWLGVMKKVRIGEKTTFDASSTPKVGQKIQRRDPAPLDVADIESRMTTIVEAARANDPATLRKRIAELEKQIATKQPPAPAGLSRAEVDRQIETLHHNYAEREARIIRSAEITVFQKLDKVKEGFAQDLLSFHLLMEEDFRKERRKEPKLRLLPQQSREVPSNARRRPNKDGRRRMLIALAQYPDGLTDTALGILSSLATGGGTFDTYLGNLRSAGFVTGGRDQLQITDAGKLELGDFDPLPTGAALREYWINHCKGGMGRMLHALCLAHPRSLSKEKLGDQANISPFGGTFDTYLGRLRTLRLVEGKSELRASETLFM